MDITNIDINEIIPYDNNPRINKNSIDKVVKSIKEYGFKQPLVIDKDNVIIVGHTRYLASKKIGLKKIPCIVANDLTEAQVKAYRIADNRAGELSIWDVEKLNLEFKELEELNFDLELTGFNLDEIKIEDELNDVVEDDFNLDEECETRVLEGDIWVLGRNILMCGDSFSEDIDLFMNGNKADLGFCDPPYDMKKDEWIDNLKHVKEGSPILLMAGDKQTIRLANKIPNFRQFIIHDREQAMLVNTATPMSQHTIISLFCDHPKKYFINLNDHFTSIIKCKKNYKTANDEMASKMGKPIKLISELISHYSKKEDIVLDLFGGGGSTLIACEQLNRICYINELNPMQCDKIIARWESFTGLKSKKMSKTIK